MSPRSSLLKRAIVPLLAVAATTFCAPARAATASFDFCGAVSVNGQQGVGERVECSVTDSSSAWFEVDYHALLLGGGDPHSSTKNVYFAGTGDYYYPSAPQAIYLGPTISGTYNCWAICDVGSSGGSSSVSTGGTNYVTF